MTLEVTLKCQVPYHTGITSLLQIKNILCIRVDEFRILKVLLLKLWSVCSGWIIITVAGLSLQWLDFHYSGWIFITVAGLSLQWLDYHYSGWIIIAVAGLSLQWLVILTTAVFCLFCFFSGWLYWRCPAGYIYNGWLCAACGDPRTIRRNTQNTGLFCLNG